MSFFPISDGGDFFPFFLFFLFFCQAHCEYVVSGCFLMVGKGAGSAGAAQYKTSASVSRRKSTGIKAEKPKQNGTASVLCV